MIKLNSDFRPEALISALKLNGFVFEPDLMSPYIGVGTYVKGAVKITLINNGDHLEMYKEIDAKKIRRRVEDTLRKSDPETILKIAKELGVKTV